MPYDHSRVVLPVVVHGMDEVGDDNDDNDNTDYINANYIPGYRKHPTAPLLSNGGAIRRRVLACSLLRGPCGCSSAHGHKDTAK